MKFKKIKLTQRVKRAILGLGSQTKNTVCFIKDDFAYLSPPHPDLATPKDFLSFEKDVKYFLKKKPKIIAYDLHPEYQSTKYAFNLRATSYELRAVQHHHGHIASCMLENGLKNQKVIGVAFDGTGLGSNHQIWGAEFFICDYKNFKRRAHLKEIPLLGGERAILEPARLTLLWLYLIYKDRFLNLDIKFAKGTDKKKWLILKNMYLKSFNSPLASSMGRLFDAVASLIFAKYSSSFEAELAIELEKIATGYPSTLSFDFAQDSLRSLGTSKLPACLAGRQATGYPYKIHKNKDGYILDPIPMFRQIVLSLKHREPEARIAYCFHLTIANMIRRVCLILRKESSLKRVVLSGGVFQNNLLLKLTLGLLYKEGFMVFTHKELSCNDSGLSLGQAVIASYRYR